MALRGRVRQLFIETRSSTGSQSVMSSMSPMRMLRERASAIRRWTVGRLTAEPGSICELRGNQAQPQAVVERVQFYNRLRRQFDVSTSSRVCCGEIMLYGHKHVHVISRCCVTGLGAGSLAGRFYNCRERAICLRRKAGRWNACVVVRRPSGHRRSPRSLRLKQAQTSAAAGERYAAVRGSSPPGIRT